MRGQGLKTIGLTFPIGAWGQDSKFPSNLPRERQRGACVLGWRSPSPAGPRCGAPSPQARVWTRHPHPQAPLGPPSRSGLCCVAPGLSWGRCLTVASPYQEDGRPLMESAGVCVWQGWGEFESRRPLTLLRPWGPLIASVSPCPPPKRGIIVIIKPASAPPPHSCKSASRGRVQVIDTFGGIFMGEGCYFLIFFPQ